jgi:DNA-binding response OmpR family regulator
MHKILICEDEENIISFLQKELEYENFEVITATNGEEATKKFTPEISLVLMDIMLPKKNGLECLREIRKTSNVPVIMLTARKEVYDKVAFLTAGADDYVTKPFETMELIARIKRHIQRTAPLPAALTITPESYRAEIHSTPLPLTKTEFEILNYLHQNAEKVKTRDEIIQAVLGDFYGESNIIDANIKNIRAKIAKITDQPIIETVRGKGYVIRHV